MAQSYKVRVSGTNVKPVLTGTLSAALAARANLIGETGLHASRVQILQNRVGGGWFLLYGLRP